MIGTKRTTLNDVAKKAGVHRTTVSLALRNSPKLPVETRAQLQSIAHEMGYVPDPALSALSAYRRSDRPTGTGYSIACVTTAASPEKWREQDLSRKSHESLYRRATELGYHLEHFWIDTKTMTKRRATQILRTRNVRGILLSGAQHIKPPDLEWEHFATVSLTQSFQEISTHVVTNNHWHTISLACSRLHALGYRRIGFALEMYADVRLHRVWSAGFLGYHALLPPQNSIPVYAPKTMNRKDFLAWRERYEPDVILTMPPHLYVVDWLKEAGVKIPREVGVASLDCDSPQSELSGIYQNYEAISRAAIDTLAWLIQRNEFGLPENPREILMRGSWVDGATTNLVRD